MSHLKANLVSVYLLREPVGSVAPGRAAELVAPGRAPELEVLLLQRCTDHTFPGDWQGVHGHIEADETAWQTALREVGEETGIDPIGWFRLIRAGSFYEPDTDTVYFVPSFVAVAAPDAAFRLSNEHQAGAWRPLREARDCFRWVTQRDDLDAIIAATQDWPCTGPELERMDVDALRRHGKERALRRRWQEREIPKRSAARGTQADGPRGLD